MSQHHEPTETDRYRSSVTHQIDRLGIHSRSPSPAKRSAPTEKRSPAKRTKTINTLASAAPTSADERTAVAHEPCGFELDRAALTWREDEITGHEIDTDPSDDGEGINGLGFKPTPRLEAQRAMKRRQQVSDYNARELSEARSQRMARRKDKVKVKEGHEMPAPTGVQAEESKRFVRFA